MSVYVYRTFDADDRLLYIGCSDDVERRLKGHASWSPWFPFLAYVTSEPFDTRAEALEAEVRAIATEHPRWNVRDRSPEHPEGFISLAYGVFRAPWLQEDIELWRQWRRDRRAAA